MKNMLQNLIRKLGLAIVSTLVVVTAWAQQSITGTVTDDGGEPLPGVTVLLQGTVTGTVQP